jgi:hypothetical protein
MQARPAQPSTAGLLTFSLLLFAASVTTPIIAHAQAPHVYTLRSDRLTANFLVAYGSLKTVVIEDQASHSRLQPDEAFTLDFRNGDSLAASQFKLANAPVEQPLSGNPSASRLAERASGTELCGDLSAQDKPLTVHWCAILRDHANYLRQEITLRAATQPDDIADVRLFDFLAPGAQVIGKVPGSPIVAGNFFFGFEHPLAVSKVDAGNATSLLARVLPLGANQSITYSSVIGVAAPGQMRREFLAYLEQERAHPYRTFLHYNSWYDLGEGERFNETQALDRIHAFGNELVRNRGVTMDSFLFDDGWDDTQSLWGFNPGLPNGFAKIRDAAAQYGFGIGVWLSPWGGYATAKKQRMIAGEKAGYETFKGGFALSAPKYYQLFETTCLNMITQYGVNQFKFDGTGNASQVFPGSLFDSDFSAAIHLIERLRQQDPNIFINLTTGTRPSPFWLRYADSIWRSGDDHSFDGVGSWRQKWITYRDEQTYRNIVLGGPLYPLSSLMLHGLIFAQKADHLGDDPANDFPDEVHSYFGSGTELQEMYITPSLLSANDWDVLAETARWSRTNAQVLKDTHWIGGDPGKLEVYGWASWTPAKAIVVLRNPANHAQTFALDVDKAFELPSGAPQGYAAKSPWSADTASAPLNLRAGQAQTIQLKPFQVLTLDAQPQN